MTDVIYINFHSHTMDIEAVRDGMVYATLNGIDIHCLGLYYKCLTDTMPDYAIRSYGSYITFGPYRVPVTDGIFILDPFTGVLTTATDVPISTYTGPVELSYRDSSIHFHCNDGCCTVPIHEDLDYVDCSFQGCKLNARGFDITIDGKVIDVKQLPLEVSCKNIKTKCRVY